MAATPLTTAESMRLLASMMVCAEKAKDAAAIARYSGTMGVLLNKINTESASWGEQA